MTDRTITIAGRRVGDGEPVFVIAELSGNHNGDLGRAIELVHRAAEAGADAVKLQTYRADTLTIDADTEWFRVGEGTLWSGRTLHDLYDEAHTPWEWFPDLIDAARESGIIVFSTPFDETAVAYHEQLDLPAQKIASFELVDHALIECAAATGKPMIMSTGMATRDEIDAAVAAARRGGATELALLHCNSAYPAPAAEMNLRTIRDLADTWDVPAGLSDHTLGTAAAVAAVGLGATIIEKHITLSRDEPGPDTAFSLEPHELAELVASVRTAQEAIGEVRYGTTEHEAASLVFRRSLFVVEDVPAGGALTTDNVRVIRPGHGLAPDQLSKVLGRRVRAAVRRGTPVSWDLLD